MVNLNPSVILNRIKDEISKNFNQINIICANENQRPKVKRYGLRVLHHNVQSLSNKKNEITMMLSADMLHINILCLTEHWLQNDQLNMVNFDQFRLVSEYCRSLNTHGGSCIYVNNMIQCKEVPWLNNLSSDKVFEASVVDLVEFRTILACIYRSPNGDFREFLHKLEVLIVKVYTKDRYIILCGDWNINFLQSNGKLQDLQHLLLMHDLINVIESPTRITDFSQSLIDVFITNISIEEF
jgi:hypothetical protein